MAAQGQFEENGIFNIQNDDDYKTVRVSFNNEHRYVGDITIPSSVKHNDKTYKVSKIGRHAFRYCRNLKTVTIPNGVTDIDICAFADCDNLTIVTIPNSVKAIGDYAFYKCNSLSTIIIPNGVNSIGKYAFWGCNNLTAVTIPNSVKSIGDQAFYNCKKLASIEMPNSNVEIGDFAFPQNTNALLKSNATRDSNPVGVKAKGVYTIKDRLKTTYLKLEANGDVYFKYEGKCLGKEYHNDEYTYWGKWDVKKETGDDIISLKQDMNNIKRWLFIIFPCSDLIEDMQSYSSLVVYVNEGKVYGGRCKMSLHVTKIQ